MAKNTPKFDLHRLADYRHARGINQQTFWKSIGITQSGGSLYETGRDIPMPAALLLVLRETGKVSEHDLAAAAAVVKKAKSQR